MLLLLTSVINQGIYHWTLLNLSMFLFDQKRSRKMLVNLHFSSFLVSLKTIIYELFKWTFHSKNLWQYQKTFWILPQMWPNSLLGGKKCLKKTTESYSFLLLHSLKIRLLLCYSLDIFRQNKPMFCWSENFNKN